jgi:hypothetical protein
MRTANAVSRTVTDYGPNPHNPAAGAVRDAMARLHGFLVPSVVGSDASAEATFHGYARPMQDFRGAAASTGNPVTNHDGGTPEISNALVEGPMGDPARRIFAARLRRRLA